MTLSASDEQQIMALFERTKAAWSANDGAAYAAAFAPDADYIGFDGACARGRDEIAQSHQQLFDGPLRGSRLFGTVERLRPLSHDVVVVIATGAATLGWQSNPPKSRLSRQTYVAVRAGQGWQFASFHNTRIRPMPRAAQWLFAALGSIATRPPKRG